MLATFLLHRMTAMSKRRIFAEKHEGIPEKFDKKLSQTDLCRTCMSTTNLMAIFNNYNDEQMSRKLKLVTDLEIRKNDSLSQKICKNCLRQVNNTLHFRIQCKATERSLITLLSQNIKSESKTNQKQCSFTEVNVENIKIEDDNEISGLEGEIKRENVKDFKHNLNNTGPDTYPCGTPFDLEENMNFRNLDCQNSSIEEDCYMDTDTIKSKKNGRTLNSGKKSPKTSAERQKKYRERLKLIKAEKLKAIQTKSTDEIKFRNKINSLQEHKKKIPPRSERVRRAYNRAPSAGPYRCECGEQFPLRASYVTHARLHTARCVCEECGKICKNNFVLQQHKRAKHGLDKIHKCGHCNYSAATKDSLTVHERRHRGERPYICDYCAVAFYTRRTLIQHIGIHLPDTIQCPICPKRLRSLRLLSNHKASAHGKRYSYQCPSCPKSFRDRKYVRRHLAAVHRMPKDQQPAIEKFLLPDQLNT